MLEGGAMQNAGNSADRETGGWRIQRPIVDMDKCTNCLICWVFCPDGSILVSQAKFKGIDLDHCKGCGICAVECPAKCITMVAETAALEEGALKK
jgi:2-oxoacid:acceptor oxidoreductase delta subunit (pyruvate/2-ketoisovalerate family)